jgi:hypothetical protein
MVAVRLARGWIGYGGAVHRAGDLVDVDAVTLAKLEACGVVTPSESTQWAGPTGGEPTEDERTVAWAGPTGDDDGDDGDGDGSGEWAGPTGDNT